MEKIIINTFNRILITKHNWSLILLTIFAWITTTVLPYYNQNFDMSSSILKNIMLLSLGSVVIGLVSKNSRLKRLGSLGVISLIVSLFTMILTKSIVPILCALGTYFLMPASLFLFFIILKNLWMELELILANQSI